MQGAAGDINPYFDKMRLEEDADKLLQETGRKLGDEAVRVARSITPKAPAYPELQFAVDVRHFKLRYDAERLLAPLKAELKPATFERYRKYLATPLDCPVTTLVINREIALAGMPGEPFVEFGFNFRDRSPLRRSFFAGYANGYFGYFPTIRAAVEGGYGAEGLVARTEVGAGESMLDTSLIRLYAILGQLKPLPAAIANGTAERLKTAPRYNRCERFIRTSAPLFRPLALFAELRAGEPVVPGVDLQ